MTRLATALLCAGTASLCLSWEAELAEPPGRGRDCPVRRGPARTVSTVLLGQAGEDGEMPRPPGAAFKKTALSPEDFRLQFKFRNFNKDALSVEVTLGKAEIAPSMAEFGYFKKDLDDIYQRYAKDGEAAYREKTNEYFIKKGFRVIGKDTVTVDIPQMIWRNLKRTNGLALMLQALGEERGYDSEEIIGAATALVQTAVAYKQPPAVDKEGRHTGGVHPPPKALALGWGDCDTKSALLGTILGNWKGIRGVGVALPKHYLIGIARMPRQGDVFLEHKGVQYVLIESAGPAWLPVGMVSDDTLAMIDRMSGIPIQPF
ncbi:MAG: hypothetical protein HY927_05250 [Elusimicrobia bacterium]|nr:hypothetical protein [Elusimicrobiota bacterium]